MSNPFKLLGAFMKSVANNLNFLIATKASDEAKSFCVLIKCNVTCKSVRTFLKRKALPFCFVSFSWTVVCSSDKVMFGGLTRFLSYWTTHCRKHPLCECPVCFQPSAPNTTRSCCGLSMQLHKFVVTWLIHNLR